MWIVEYFFHNFLFAIKKFNWIRYVIYVHHFRKDFNKKPFSFMTWEKNIFHLSLPASLYIESKRIHQWDLSPVKGKNFLFLRNRRIDNPFLIHYIISFFLLLPDFLIHNPFYKKTIQHLPDGATRWKGVLKMQKNVIYIWFIMQIKYAVNKI